MLGQRDWRRPGKARAAEEEGKPARLVIPLPEPDPNDVCTHMFISDWFIVTSTWKRLNYVE